MARSAYGFDTGSDTRDWWHHAACRSRPERAQPTYGVQAGVLWTNQGGQSKLGEPARYQPAELDPNRCPACNAPARAYRHQKPTAPSTVLVDA